ncbi:hypothetical protein [Nocardioides cavernae]|nr:hypothetical protein [Nocardioides cavernae]
MQVSRFIDLNETDEHAALMPPVNRYNESRITMTTPITTDLAVLRQAMNVDVESVAPSYGYNGDAYDVVNSTITATVQVPLEAEYRLVLAGQVESGTSAIVRVVSATDQDFKNVENFKRINKGEASIIKPVLDKAGIVLDPALDERDQLIEHAANYKVADIRLPAGQHVLRIHASEKLTPVDGDPRQYRFTMYAPQLSLAPVANVRLGVTVVFPLDFAAAIQPPLVEALPNQVQPNLVAGSDQPVTLGAQQAYGWAFQADPKITMTYRYA